MASTNEAHSDPGREPTPAPSHELLTGSNFTAKDLALCSSEEARSFIPATDAIANRVLPLALLRDPKKLVLHVAVHDSDRHTEQALRFLTGMSVSLTAVPEDVLVDAIPLAYLGSEARLEAKLQRVTRTSASDKACRLSKLPPPSGDAAQFITALIEFAAVRGASDLHLVPTDDGALIKMRVDGTLLIQRDRPYAREFHEQVVSRLKILANLNIGSKLVPHDGSFSFSIGKALKSARISTLPTVFGESVAVRFLSGDGVPQISSLGMEPMALMAVRGAIERSEGIILLTGPTGSGKTTTMYALVLELERRGRNVVTVEDPVEIPLPGTVQVQVAVEQGLDYPRAIRSVLRHDPDVLLIGEMRDGLSASMALDAASTGHLTVSSLHVGSALQTLHRLEVLGVPRSRSIPPIVLVVNQRLLPKLCARCSDSHGNHIGNLERKRGELVECQTCNGSGFSGRVLITEVLDLQSARAKEACYRTTDPNELIELLPSGAFIPWTEALHYHSARGEISLAQVEEFLASEWD